MYCFSKGNDLQKVPKACKCKGIYLFYLRFKEHFVARVCSEAPLKDASHRGAAFATQGKELCVCVCNRSQHGCGKVDLGVLSGIARQCPYALKVNELVIGIAHTGGVLCLASCLVVWVALGVLVVVKKADSTLTICSSQAA